MARPEDSAARSNARNGAGYDQANDDAQGALRRDPRRPFDQRGREEPSLRAQSPQPQAARAAGPGVTPQFDPYVQQSVPRQPAPQARPPMPAEPRRDQPAHQPGYSQDPYAQPRTARPNGYAPPANLPPQAAGRPAPTQRPATQGYPAPNGNAQQAGYAPLQGQPLRSAANAQQGYAQQGYDPVPPSGRVREPFFEAPPSARQAPPPRQHVGVAQDGYGEDPYADTSASRGNDADYDDEAGDDTDLDQGEPAPRRRTAWFVAGGIAAAIALGGGLGYAYKLSGAHRTNGNLPVVQADAAPVKMVPVDAAGSGADPDKKTILERVDTSSASAPAATVSSQEKVATDAAAPADALAVPRKVATVVVKPGEKIAAMAAPAATDAQPVDAFPGLSVGGDDPAAAQPAPAPAQSAAAAGLDPATQPLKLGKPPKKMKVAAIVPPSPQPDATATADAPTDPVPADPTLPGKSKAASATPKAGAGSGYLIQVRSTHTQAEALAYFADLQQRYGDLLGAAQPDIQTADLGTKGTWYRLRIGPPGSSAAAHDLCVKLKASGLKDCITAPY